MPFAAKWSTQVKEAVYRAALDPERPSATVIRNGLLAGAVDGIEPGDVPPIGTVRLWVTESRRAARKALGTAGAIDGIDQIGATLQRKLERHAARAKTPRDIAEVAKAARALAELRKDVSPRKSAGASQEARTEAQTQEEERAAFLRGLGDAGPAQ
jgi:hypothetical protein